MNSESIYTIETKHQVRRSDRSGYKNKIRDVNRRTVAIQPIKFKYKLHNVQQVKAKKNKFYHATVQYLALIYKDNHLENYNSTNKYIYNANFIEQLL